MSVLELLGPQQGPIGILRGAARPRKTPHKHSKRVPREAQKQITTVNNNMRAVSDFAILGNFGLPLGSSPRLSGNPTEALAAARFPSV